jgi:hypothetical protein
LRHAGRISWKNDKKDTEDIYVRFKTQEEMSSCNREISLLRTLIDDLTKIKFKFLAEDESLLNAYESLVLKDIVSEEEFWNQKEEVREWNKISSMASQNLARTSKNLVKSLYTGGNTKIEGLKLDEIGKMKLLKREEKLMEKYMKEVKTFGMKDEDFWRIFEKDQIDKTTVLVGGMNPIYVGDEEEYKEREKFDLDIKVDILKNTESFDLTAKLFENFKTENKSNIDKLIEKSNKRNIRVLNEDFLVEMGKNDEDLDEEFRIDLRPKIDLNKLENENLLFANKKILKENDRKAYVWEEEAWINMKNQMISLQKENQNFKNLVFDEENKHVRNVFEQTLKWINQRLSKKNINFSHYEDEYKSFEEEWKSLHQEANKVLSFFYMNLKKAQETKDDHFRLKYSNNCKEITEILQKLREKVNRLKQNKAKLGETTLKSLNNLLERFDTSLKLLH